MHAETGLVRNSFRRCAANLAIASAFGVIAAAPMAAIVDSGPVNIAVPQTNAGIYLNLVTGVFNTNPASAPGWDINPWGSSVLTFFTSTNAANTNAVVGVQTASKIAAVLAPGYTIGPGTPFVTAGSISAPGFRVTGTEYVGISFMNELTGFTNYGYVQLSTTITGGFPAAIVRYVYENSGAAITIPGTPPVVTLMISEFRLRGLNGPNDEYIEIYNGGTTGHTVASSSGTGYAIAASDGIVRCTIPNGTYIQKAGHYLCTNSVGYSIGAYPSGAGTATGDATYATDIPDNAGIALFNNDSGGGSFTLANRFDAVGSTSEANTLYKEGTGYPAITPLDLDNAFVRDQCGKGGAVNLLGPCTTSLPIDTNNNAADFYYVDLNGTSVGAGQRLGAPGPQNLGSPISGGTGIATLPLDSTVNVFPPNVVRDFTSVPAQNSTFGTISIRKRVVNNTGAPLTRLRFRVVDIDTFPALLNFADLRTRTSSAVVVSGVNDPATCAASGFLPPCTINVQGTHMEGGAVGEFPYQPNGGAFNSTFSVDSVTAGTPLANGASVDVQFLFGIQQAGNYRVGMIAEGLPAGGDVFMVACNTDGPCTPNLASAVSRRVHGGAGTFDLPLSLVPAGTINHNPTTDPRQGPLQTIVFTYDRPLSAVTAAVTEGTAAIGVMTFSGNTVVVPLTGVTDKQYVTVSLTNVSGTDGSTNGVGSARIGFLVGDVNQTRVVSIADLGLVNAQLAQPLTATNYLKDVNASGTLTLADKGITNANLTKALPNP